MFDDRIISEAARRIVAAAPGSEVILFGSHARGDAGRNSDVDLMVVEPSVHDPIAESVRLRRELSGLDLFADLLVVSRGEADRWAGVHGSVIHAALAEGRPVRP